MRDFLSLHPATRMLLWISLAIFSFSAAPTHLAVLSLAILASLVFHGGRLFLRLLRRVRWILVSLLAIYAFETPGEALFSHGPTWEGLASGGLQAWRIVLTVALLAFLQASTSREMMLSGIHTLLMPLRRWINIERIAVRLLLTLHYAEEKKQGDWRERLNDVFGEKEEPELVMTLPVYRFGMRDLYAFLAIALALML